MKARRRPPPPLNECDSELPGIGHISPESDNAATVWGVAIPLDEGAQDRRRVGPFWLEEGTSGALLGGALLALFVVLFVLAVIFRPV